MFVRYLTLALIFITGNSFAAERPNILLLSVDDLNDWVGVLDGHPQAKTPNIDRLAARGTLFYNAHCQAPVCNPSRASLMTSILPSSSGIYFLNPPIASSPLASKAMTMPQRFQQEGYEVMAAGKLFHARENKTYFPKYAGNFGGFGPVPKEKISHPRGHPLWDWGIYPDNTVDMPDDKTAKWTIQHLQKNYTKPFFIAAGFFRPHVPMYAPPEWFDMHPRNKIQLPLVKENDREDLSEYARNLTTLEHVAPLHEWVKASGEWPHAVQAYLASTSLADACVGQVLDVLNASPYKDNTIVVLFSDHGFHLGEKERWAKRSLWDDGTRVPMIIVNPFAKDGENRITKASVGLIDIYPTLLELCGLEADPIHEGHSLMPLLHDPNADWEHPAITSFGPGNHAVRTERWRYIRYNDGSEELYDHATDPHEWTNLAAQAKCAEIIKKHRAMLPIDKGSILGKGSTGHLAFSATEAIRAQGDTK